MQNQKPSLKVHEWMAVTAIIVVMLALTLISVFKRKYGSHSYNQYPNSKRRIEVILKGAVVHTGIYTLPHDMRLGELLEIAETTREADLRRFNMDRPIQQGRVINIPKREMMTVYVKGDENQIQTVKVPRGTSLEGLIDKIDFPEGFNTVVLKKKRRLKDGETIQLMKQRK